MSIEQIQLDAQYDDTPFAEGEVMHSDYLPEGTFKDSKSISDDTSGTGTMEPDTNGGMSPPPQPSHSDYQDMSQPIFQERLDGVQMVPLDLALGLWCANFDLSRSQYKNLRAILKMLEPNDLIARLPERLDALRRSTSAQLPQLNSQHVHFLYALRNLRVPRSHGSVMTLVISLKI